MKIVKRVIGFWIVLALSSHAISETTNEAINERISQTHSTTPLNKEQTSIDIELMLPKIDAHPYHKPFVAVWLETADRQPIETIAIWYDDAEWLKDLRQWWRKLGREQHLSGAIDSISGATQKPGTHLIRWKGTVDVKEAMINIEVAREEGGRSYHREAISMTQGGKYKVMKSHEYGDITIYINRKNAH